MSSRIFLVDHMCVLPYGHNLGALLLFQKAMQEKFQEIVCLASRELSDVADQSNKVERELFFPYAGSFEIKGTISSRSRLYPIICSLIPKALKRIAYTGLANMPNRDYIRYKTMLDWIRVFQKYSIGKKDVLFFPSTDYYGCLSLFDYLENIPASKHPKIHLRMIGVMEYASYRLCQSKYHFFYHLRRSISNGISFTVSAETPKYSKFISKIINKPVTYMPYPLIHKFTPIRWEYVKTLSSPGQGREDKGFFRIYKIISEIYRYGFGEKFRFDVQNMRVNDLGFRKAYQSMLQKVPYLRLRAETLSDKEILEIYQDSDILLLPYDTETYQLRGSAVYQEGIAIGRPVVCSRGTGISELVERYGNGLLANDDREFAQKIIELSQLSRLEIIRMVEKSREVYLADVENGISEIFGRLNE